MKNKVDKMNAKVLVVILGSHMHRKNMINWWEQQKTKFISWPNAGLTSNKVWCLLHST